MRIGLVTPEYVTEKRSFDGGLANYLYRLSLSLVKLGHQPVVFTLSDQSGVIISDDIEVHRVEAGKISAACRIRGLMSLGRERQALKLMHQSRLLNDEVSRANGEKKIDIVQYASYRSVGYHRVAAVPGVIRISSYQKLWDRAYHGENIRAKHLSAQRLEEKTLESAFHIFGPGRFLAREIEKDIGTRVRVIETPFILECHEYDASVADAISGEYLLFFGSIGVLKGAAVIAVILEQLLGNYPHLRFVFAGKDMGIDGRSAEEHLRKMGGRYSDRIVFTGILKHPQLYPVISGAAAVVLPSLIDNFPNSCLEAMAHGKIVIGTRESGFEQLIEDGVNGYLCRRGDSSDLFDTIDEVLRLPEEKKITIGKAARISVERLHPDRTVTGLVEYYREVIADFEGYRDGRDLNRVACEAFNRARRLFHKGRFSEAVKTMTSYRGSIDYNLFNIEDNRKRNDRSRIVPSISVIVVAYDTNRLLIECLDSLSKQDSDDYEVIVVDNGFNETVRDRLREMDILYIETPQNLYLSEGRNIGAKFARGKIITFLDDDALVAEDYIGSVKKAFESYDICGFRGRVLEKKGKMSNIALRHYDLGETPIPSIINAEGNSAFIKEIYEEYGGMEPLLFGHEGWEFSYRVSRDRGENSFIYWPKTVIYHDYADSDSKLSSKSGRHSLMNEFIKNIHPEAVEYRKRMKRFITGDKSRAERLIKRK
ncbi:MAG: glycosyltransferase [Candidatus Krumholzibacteriota bacterium]|nr:glycosyltransferase [Candidatus Krumholzibacteriota bacterium]